MGLVLAFETQPRPSSVRAPVKPSEPAKSADILFFTGVRYERHGESTASTSHSTSAPDLAPPSS